MEPVGFGDVALGDREKAGQPRFGGQQVVVRRIAAARPLVVRETIADGEQLPLRVVEESEVHAVEQGDGANGQLVEIVERAAAAPSVASPAASCCSATDSVRSAPARLPLSTVEI